MNAHVPARISSTAPLNAAQSPCPAEAIGLALELAHREICERGSGEGAYGRSGSHWNGSAIEQLEDRVLALGAQLEWVKATTLRGVAAQFAELERAIMQSRGSEGAGAAERRVDRLSALIAAALGDLAGADDYELGRGTGAPDPSVFAEVLFTHTGQWAGWRDDAPAR
jgi:hypothetical protein